MNFNGTNNSQEPGGYIATIADRRLVTNFQGQGSTAKKYKTMRPFTSTKVSEAVMGSSISITALNSTSLFGTNTKLLTTLTIEGVDSGARVTIPVEISKQVVANVATQGETGISLA